MQAVMAEGHCALMPPPWPLKTPLMLLIEQAVPEDIGDEVKGDEDSMELPPSRRAAWERRKRTPARPQDVPFPSTVKSLLQKAQNETKMKGSTNSLGWSLDEDDCMNLASLLQKTMEFLEALENKSRKDVKEVAETDQTCRRIRPRDTNLVISLSVWRDSKKRLVEAREKLEGILARCKKCKEPKSENLDVLILSTVKSYLQVLLEVLTGDAAEDFQKLQDSSLQDYWLSKNNQNEKLYKKEKVAMESEKALKYMGTSVPFEEAVKLLPEVKDDLLHLCNRDAQSTLLFGNLLQVISEKLQAMGTEVKKKEVSQITGWRLNEDACLELVTLLQKTVELLEAGENRSGEESIKLDEATMMVDNTTETVNESAMEVADTAMKVDGPAMKVDGPAMKVDDTAMKVDDTAIKVDDTAMTVDDTAMKGDDTAMKGDGPAMTVDNTAMKVVDTAMEVADTAMKGDDTDMKEDDTSMKVDDTAMKGDDTAMKGDDTAMKVDGTAMKGDGTAMKGDDTAIKVDDTAMKVDDTAMKGDDTDMKVDDTAMKVDDTAMKADDTAMKGDDTAMKADDTAMKVDDTVMKVDDTAMKGDDTAIKVDDTDIKVDDTALKVDEAYCNSMKQWNANSFLSFKILKGSRRAWMGVMTSTIPRLLSLLLLTSLLGVSVAASVRVQGSGRAEQGQAYSLTCVVEGLPGIDTSSYLWYKDGDVIREEAKQVLTFTRLTQGDAGMYQCEQKLADRTQSLLSEPFQLLVLVLENVVMVPEVEVEEGQTAILNCSVHSVPTARLCWMMDAKILHCSESNSDSLVLHNAWRFHLKVFHCQASNSEFFKILGADTQVRKKGTYEIMPKPLLSSEGLPVLHQPFKLLCMQFDFPEHTAHIRLSHTWYKDHREIPGQSGAELQFDKLTREDRGMYSCVARNGKPETTSPESNQKDLLILVPPHVHMEPATPDNVISRAAGEELTLTCKVTEAIPWVPAYGYSWSYLPSHGGPRRPLVGRESTLRLGSLTRNDSGRYFCQARNDLEVFQGQIPPGNASVTVNILYIEQIALTADLKANDENRLTLTCSVASNPAARLSWLVDGREVRHVTYNVDHYVVEGAACSDNKTYTCRASNADLPGLERHASTNVGVVCNGNEKPATGSTLSSLLTPSPLLWLLVLVLVPVIML